MNSSHRDLRLPPHRPEAEAALVASIFQDPAVLEMVSGVVSEQDFYRLDAREVFAAAVALAANGRPFDVVSVAEHLDASGKMDAVGGMAGLGALDDAAGSSANAVHYATLIAAAARSRRLIAALAVAADAAHELAPDEVGDQLAAALARWRNLGANPLIKFVDMCDFASTAPQPPEFVIHPIIPRGFVTLLGGHGEIGKSMLGLTLAAHVATGTNWADMRVSPGRVLYLSLEDAGEMALHRLQIIAAAYGLDASNLTANLTIADASDAGPLAQEFAVAGVKSLKTTRLAEDIGKLIPGHDLIVIDNASDAFDGDENSRRQVRTFIKFLATWAKGQNAAVLLLVHIDKHAARNGSQGNSYSGSTAWHNSARSRLAMSRNPRTELVELAHEKLNLGRKLEEPICLSWSADGALLPMSANAKSAAATLADGALDEPVFRAVCAALAAGTTVHAATTGPATAWHALQPLPEFPDALREPSGKAKLNAVLVRLARQGMIRQETYRRDYKSRERWTT